MINGGSKYQPQLGGWSTDLIKAPIYLANTDDRLRYADDTWCEIARQITAGRIAWTLFCVFVVCAAFFVFFVTTYSTIIFLNNGGWDNVLLILFFCGYGGGILALIAGLPGIYKSLFSPQDTPLRLNRYTRKVYINENFFFRASQLYHPIRLFTPFHKRVKEYNWDDIYGVVLTFHQIFPSGGATTRYNQACMVCKPGTNEVIDHILLYYNQALYDTRLWYWMCSYMEFREHLSFDDAKPSSQSKINNVIPFIFPKADWPEWMEEAKTAKSLDELTQIKQQYNVTE